MKRTFKVILIFVLLSKVSNCQEKIIQRIESVQSLYVEIFKGELYLGKATGFVIKSNTSNYLITNWHVATNKDPRTKKWINPKVPVSPDNIKILHNSNILGKYKVTTEKLINETGKKTFKEFYINKEMVDVVAIPLTDTINNIKIYPVNYMLTYDSLLIAPMDRVFVLGFPLGYKSAPAMPIWKSGLIASEPDIDQENKPIIWIDMIGYPGMSGSPVYYISDKLYYKNGTTVNIFGRKKSFFMGVFSHGKEDISTGALWKGVYLKKLFNRLP